MAGQVATQLPFYLSLCRQVLWKQPNEISKLICCHKSSLDKTNITDAECLLYYFFDQNCAQKKENLQVRK